MFPWSESGIFVFDVLHNVSTVLWTILPATTIKSHLVSIHRINTGMLSFAASSGFHVNDFVNTKHPHPDPHLPGHSLPHVYFARSVFRMSTYIYFTSSIFCMSTFTSLHSLVSQFNPLTYWIAGVGVGVRLRDDSVEILYQWILQ